MALLVFCLSSVAVLSPVTVGAELTDSQSTFWGVEGEAPSSTISNWDALTFAVEPIGTRMFVGGKFLTATNGTSVEEQKYLAAFNAATGTFDTSFRPNVGGAVTAIAQLPDGGVLIGGEMGTWENQTVGALVKINPDTGVLWPGWNTRVYGGSSVVRDINVAHDGWVYISGSFNTASDTPNQPFPVTNIIRLNPATGAVDRNWLPNVTGGSVWGAAPSYTQPEVYLSGWFTASYGDANTRGFAGVSSVDGSLVHTRSSIPFNTCVGCTGYHRMYGVEATPSGDVWVGGEQHAMFILDEATDLSLEKMHYTNCNLNYQADCKRSGGEFQDVELIGNRIYATCHCWGSHMTSTSNIMHSSRPTGTYTGSISGVATYDAVTGERIQAWNPWMAGKTGGFDTSQAADGCLWVAGSFNSVGFPGSTVPGRDLLRFCDQGAGGEIPFPTPVSCTISQAAGVVNITFQPSPTADSIIVERNAGNGWFWRGKVIAPATTFSESAPVGTEYRVKARYGTVNSDPIPCGTTVPEDPAGTSPMSCSVTAVDSDATVTWASVPSAVDYRVYRRVNGSDWFWRGKVDAPATSFADTLRNGSHEYSVQARVNGQWSDSTVCLPPVNN